MKDHDDNLLLTLFFRLPPENIVYLNCLLESYDGLGVLRTLDAVRGEVVVLATQGVEKDLRLLLSDLAGSLNLREISPPQSIANDWLLSGA